MSLVADTQLMNLALFILCPPLNFQTSLPVRLNLMMNLVGDASWSLASPYSLLQGPMRLPVPPPEARSDVGDHRLYSTVRRQPNPREGTIILA